MAASEYYHQIPAGNGAGPNPSLASRPHNLSPQPSHFYPQAPPTSNPQPQQAPPPPPYQPVEVPAEKPYRPIDQQCQRNSFSHPQRPPAQVWNAPYNQITPVPHNQDYYPFYPQDPPKHSQYPPQSMYQNPPPHLRPYHAYSSTPNLAQGYSSDPEPRRRRRSRNKSPSRSRAADGFLGAAGGGLIGDLIFPGLGTLGGAVAGYFGGKDYGKHRERRESMNREEQRLWEAKYGKRRHSRQRRYS